jgi:hypothetical protein
MNSEPSTVCPSCGAMLPTTGLTPGVLVQCSRCGKQFNLDAVAPIEQKTSGKAITSMILGFIPVPLLTGLPAIILGIWALADIRRHAGHLRGSGMAACGIAFGSICTFLCTPLIGVSTWFAINIAKNSNFTDDPEEAAAIAARIGEMDIPEGLEPIAGLETDFLGWRMAVFGDQPHNPTTMIMLMKFPAVMAANQQQMEQQMQQQLRVQRRQDLNIQETKVLTYTIRGQPVQVTEGLGKDPNTGQVGRQYMAMVAGDSGPTMVMLITQEPGANTPEPPDPDAAPVYLTEDQVKRFYESIK